MKEPKSVVLGCNGPRDVLVNESWIDEKAFSEEADSSASICESRKGDPSLLPSFANFCELQVIRQYPASHACVNSPRSSLAQLCIAVMVVVEAFKSP